MSLVSPARRQMVWSVVMASVLGFGTVARGDYCFGTPKNLGPPVNSASNEHGVSISTNGLELYFTSMRVEGGDTDTNVWRATRASTEDDWGVPVRLASPISAPGRDWLPWLSQDGLDLYFSSDRAGGYGGFDIYVTRRDSIDAAWGPVENLGPPINSYNGDYGACISSDGLELYFSSMSFGGYGGMDLFVAKRPDKDSGWGEPQNLGPVVNDASHSIAPSLSPDGLHLFFSDLFMGGFRGGGMGSTDIWVTTRKTLHDDWTTPVNLGSPINTTNYDSLPRISQDGSTLTFCSGRSGGVGDMDIWQAPILPIADFNGDGKVDGKDVLIMTASWGQDDSLCDIGPSVFGDGVVDLQDVVVLAEYIGQDVIDSTLVAHWALDETEGVVVHDSAGASNGTVMGIPTWRPDGGQANGALEFNGTFFVVTNFALSPAEGPFSVLAWIKGGQPGQGILSQHASVNDCLLADPLEGKLATGLSTDQDGYPLCSDVVITDGNWHRVGVIWDGSTCMLSVDDVLVAQKAEGELAGSADKVVIGCGGNVAPGTLWTGLIDDVRIYNRAVKP